MFSIKVNIYGGRTLLNQIPWYVALFQSLPEAYLMINLGLILFRININTKDSFIIASVSAVFSYLIRKYFVTYGIHTVITIVLLIILVTLIGKIKVICSVVGVFTGVLITGVLQSVTIPILLSVNEMQINDLATYPVFNILFFIPCALIMSTLYLLSKKKDFYLFDFDIYVRE